jgi:hypothetical protein
MALTGLASFLKLYKDHPAKGGLSFFIVSLRGFTNSASVKDPKDFKNLKREKVCRPLTTGY